MLILYFFQQFHSKFSSFENNCKYVGDVGFTVALKTTNGTFGWKIVGTDTCNNRICSTFIKVFPPGQTVRALLKFTGQFFKPESETNSILSKPIGVKKIILGSKLKE